MPKISQSLFVFSFVLMSISAKAQVHPRIPHCDLLTSEEAPSVTPVSLPDLQGKWIGKGEASCLSDGKPREYGGIDTEAVVDISQNDDLLSFKIAAASPSFGPAIPTAHVQHAPFTVKAAGGKLQPIQLASFGAEKENWLHSSCYNSKILKLKMNPIERPSADRFEVLDFSLSEDKQVMTLKVSHGMYADDCWVNIKLKRKGAAPVPQPPQEVYQELNDFFAQYPAVPKKYLPQYWMEDMFRPVDGSERRRDVRVNEEDVDKYSARGYRVRSQTQDTTGLFNFHHEKASKLFIHSSEQIREQAWKTMLRETDPFLALCRFDNTMPSNESSAPSIYNLLYVLLYRGTVEQFKEIKLSKETLFDVKYYLTFMLRDSDRPYNTRIEGNNSAYLAPLQLKNSDCRDRVQNFQRSLKLLIEANESF